MKIAIAALILFGLSVSNANAQNLKLIRVEGASTLTGVFQQVASEFGPKHKVGVSVGNKGSGAGEKCLVDSSCEIGIVSREVKSPPAGVQVDVLGWDSVALVIDPRAKVSNLTTEQVGQVFNGKVKNWKEFGGADLAIRPYHRAKGRGTRDLVDGVFKITESGDEAGTNDEVLNKLRFYTPGGISYVSMGIALKNAGKGYDLVSIDGVVPSETNVKSGAYKIKRPLIMMYKKEGQHPVVTEFIKYTHERKKEILESNEFLAQ